MQRQKAKRKVTTKVIVPMDQQLTHWKNQSLKTQMWSCGCSWTSLPPTHTLLTFLSSPFHTHLAIFSSQVSHPKTSTAPSPPFPSRPTVPKLTSCTSHNIPFSSPPNLPSIPTTFAPPIVAKYKPSATPTLHLASPPLTYPTCRLTKHACRTVSIILAEYPPLTSVPSPTSIPASSRSRTGHIPLPNAELLAGQWLIFASRAFTSPISSGLRCTACARMVRGVSRPCLS